MPQEEHGTYVLDFGINREEQEKAKELVTQREQIGALSSKRERSIELKCGHFSWQNCSCPNNQPLPQKIFAAQEVMQWKPESGIPDYAKHNDKEILGFFGEYRWLSNFWQTPVFFNGAKFPSTEHAFQYAKLDPAKKNYEGEYERICLMSPGQVKRWASAASFEKEGFVLRPDWEEVKYDVMMDVVFDKYFRHRSLRKKLLATGDRYLEETNTWKDQTWGVCNGQGKNWLGKISMKVRDIWTPYTARPQPQEDDRAFI